MRPLWVLVPLLAAALAGVALQSDAPGTVTREDLATAGSLEGAHRLVRFVQVTDIHLLDDDAPFPLRQEQLDARGPPFNAAQRPQEEYTDEVLAAAVQAINGQHAQEPLDFVLFTGDSIDNALENELMRFLDVVQGTTTAAGPASGLACQPDGQSADTADASHDIANQCTSLPAGLAHPGLAAGLPWYQVLGNHDKLIQGNLAVLPSFQQVAAQDGRHFLAPGEFVGLHFPNGTACPAAGAGHGFGLAGDRLCDGDPANDGYYAFSAGSVRFVVLDTVNAGTADNLPVDQLGAGATAAQLFGGHADGTLDAAQKAWLDGEVAAHPDQLVIVASHHTLSNFAQPTVRRCLLGTCIDSPQSAPGEPPLATQLAEDLAARPNVVAWLGGHSHRDHIEPRGGSAGGFWSIETAGLIDAPQEARIVEVWVAADGHKGFLRTEPLAVQSEPANTLAAGDPQRFQGSEGQPQDRATRLWFNVPAGFVAPAPPPPPTTATGESPIPLPVAGGTQTAPPAAQAPDATAPTSTTAPSVKDLARKLPAPGLLVGVLLLALASRRR
ncbi:MAG: hypothetical protein QOG31_1240 [Thermoplasmata archaeon]|jgi:3',5'-cyclic AMP phosphodiesterase CpdA|nr:hypothetical protein [Thermoplasmata archaeon]